MGGIGINQVDAHLNTPRRSFGFHVDQGIGVDAFHAIGIAEMSTLNDSKCILAIGNFDGVHRGHAALLAQARRHANAMGLPVRVLTFEPHPRQFFKADTTPFRITLAPAPRRSAS